MAICVFDIHEDQSATVPGDSALIGTGVYRWWHFDLSDPDLEGWAHANLPAIPAEALLQSETRPRCDRYENGLILNLRGINMNAGQPVDQMVSIRMWATQNVIITVRLRRVFAIDDIRQEIAANRPPPSAALFLEDLIIRLTSRVQTHVLGLARDTDVFEDLAADEDSDPPPNLGTVRRSVIKLRRYLEPQRAALQRLATSDAPFFSPADLLKLREQANKSTLAVEELDALRDRLMTMQDHHDTQASLRQGRNGYALSIVAAIFLPLGFVTGLFGVNVGGMPGIQNPWAFAILSIAMVGLAGAMALVMRWMRWWL